MIGMRAKSLKSSVKEFRVRVDAELRRMVAGVLRVGVDDAIRGAMDKGLLHRQKL